MTREEYNRRIEDKKYSIQQQKDRFVAYYHVGKSYIKSLEQQNTELQKERSNMQATHQSTIESYRKEISALQEEKEGLQSLVDFKQQEISVLESRIEELVIQKSQAYRQGADDVYLLLTGKKVYD